MTEFVRTHLTLYRILRIIILCAIIAGFFWYVAFQARFLIAGPEITLTYEPSTLQERRLVAIEGTAHNVVSITLNGRPIFIDEEGHFRQPLVLPDGYTIMTIRATDRYGRTTVIERPFVYTPRS